MELNDAVAELRVYCNQQIRLINERGAGRFPGGWSAFLSYNALLKECDKVFRAQDMISEDKVVNKTMSKQTYVIKRFASDDTVYCWEIRQIDWLKPTWEYPLYCAKPFSSARQALVYLIEEQGVPQTINKNPSWPEGPIEELVVMIDPENQ